MKGRTEILAKRAGRSIGASTVAIAAMLLAAPAWAQSDPQSDASGTQDAGPSAKDDPIVVTGLRAWLQDARQRKKNSEQIIDSISAQCIGAPAHRSVPEPRQRLAGA